MTEKCNNPTHDFAGQCKDCYPPKPIGVSQWKSEGVRLGYWAYFEDEVRVKVLKEYLVDIIVKYRSSILEGKGFDFFFVLMDDLDKLKQSL